jgi:hypothetical protein
MKQNKLNKLLIALLILALIFPRPARADFFGIVDLIETALEGVEETAGPIANKAIITVFFSYLLGFVSAFTSALLLQYATQNPQWLSITENDMVRSGWYFASGIANISIILILIAIAFAYILKIETFQAKKALPKLIIVALLINFSLLFVGILVDISNIFFQAILKDNKDLPIQILIATVGGAFGMLRNLALTIVGLTVCFMTPLASVLCQAGVPFAIASLVFFPNFAEYFFHIFGLFLISSMFFVYAFLFGARVFVVELLAILSPIAFLCYILPQTKKFWDEWLKHLTDWLLLGIILFFFLVIGLKAAKFIMPPGGAMLIPGFSWFVFSDFFRYYFFLFVYLVIALWLSKRFTPEIGKVLIEQGKAFGGFFWERGVKPLIAKPIGERIAKEIAKRRPPPPQKMPKGLPIIGGKTIEELATGPSRIGRWVGRGYLTYLESWKNWMAKKEGEAEKIKTPALLESMLLSAVRDDERAAYLSAAIKKGGPFKEIATKYVEEAIKAAASAMKIGAVKETERITRTLLTENWQNNVQKLERIGFENPESKLEELIKKAKGDEIKEFNKRLWASSRAMELINTFWHGGQIEVGGREFGEDFLKPFQEMVNKKQKEDPEWYAINNPRLYRYLTSGAARTLGIGLTITIPRERLREIELLRDRPDLISATKERRETIKKIEELERKIRAGGPPEELEKTKTTLENLRKTLEGVEETLVKEEPKLKDLWEEEKARKKRRRV